MGGGGLPGREVVCKRRGLLEVPNALRLDGLGEWLC